MELPNGFPEGNSAPSRPPRRGEIELADRLPGPLDGLSELERQALAVRLFQNLKQHQIESELGYSQMHVSRLLRRPPRQMCEQLV